MSEPGAPNTMTRYTKTKRDGGEMQEEGLRCQEGSSEGERADVGEEKYG